MFGSAMVEVAIGVVFIFILVSIIASAVREGLESLLKTRAAYLEHGIRQLLHDMQGTGLAKDFFNHPQIYALFPSGYTPGKTEGGPKMTGGNLPSYIPSKNFAAALLDLVARGTDHDAAAANTTALVSLDAVRSGVATLGNSPVARTLLHAIDTAQGDLDKAQKNLEQWYDSGMDRVSGWYKRTTQWILFAMGLFVAVGLNINTVAIAKYLYWNEAARAAVVKIAETQADEALKKDYPAARASLESLDIPVGWRGYRYVGFKTEDPWNDVVSPIFGWLLTAFAAAMGAPFWFDVLNKIMVIRSTVKPHEKSREEGSEDRQVPSTLGTVAALQAAFAGAGGGSVAAVIPSDERDVDDAGLAGAAPTSDEQLPAAEGGVK